MTTYGEPVRLPGREIHFLNWKYIRHGWMSYRRDATRIYDGANPMAGMLYNGDGETPAQLETNGMPRGVRLEVQRAVLTPFEGYPLGHDPTILFDGGRYRAWYATVPANNADWAERHKEGACAYNEFIAYAESDDGFSWHTPSLGLVDVDGSKANNYILRNPWPSPTLGWGSVFIDPTSEGERYKMLISGQVTEAQWEHFDRRYPGEINPMARKGHGATVTRHGLFGAVSPDGKAWRMLPEPLCIDHCDTVNTGCYDAERGRYVAYVRSWAVPAAAGPAGGHPSPTWFNAGKRAAARCVSTDFRHFTRPEVFLGTGADMAPTHFWYTICKTHLPGQPGEGVLFPWRWEMERDRGACHLFTSQDQLAWAQVPGGPVIEAGPPGSPEGGYVHAMPGLVELHGDRWGLPYMGWPIPHKYPGRNYQGRHGLFPGVRERTGYAVWPKGRLVALCADDAGEFQTLAFYPPGSRLTLNAAIQPAGSVRISLLTRDEHRNRIPVRGFSEADCDPVTGDGLALPVSWRGRREMPPTNQALVLHVFLRNARLYAIGFA